MRSMYCYVAISDSDSFPIIAFKQQQAERYNLPTSIPAAIEARAIALSDDSVEWWSARFETC